MRYLAIDFGTRRLGLAVCDENETLASPYATRERRGTKADIADIIHTLRGLGASGIVMGRPHGMQDGTDSASSAGAARFAAALQAALQTQDLSIEIQWWDERLSTRQALGQMRESGVSQKQARGESGDKSTDARAAAVFLQNFLDAESNRTEPATRQSQTAMQQEEIV